MAPLPKSRRSALLAARAASFALVMCVTPREASAFCRTTTLPVPPNYSPTEKGCFTDGLLLFWRNACVGYSINRAASVTIPFDTAQRVVDAAFATWMASTCSGNGRPLGITVSNVGAAECGEVQYRSSAPNQNVIVFRDRSWPYSDLSSSLGLTTVTFDADTGEMFDADMEINNSRGALTATERVAPNGFDLASVITHEAGHFLGLAHAADRNATMFANYRSGTTLRTLGADDVAGICSIYPNASSRVVSLLSLPCTWCRPAAAGATEVIFAEACDPTARHGFTTECTNPPQSRPPSGCSASPSSTSSSSGSRTIALLIAGLLMVRKRRA